MIAQVVILVQLWDDRQKSGERKIWFHDLTLPKQTCLAAPEFSLVWGRVHYIQCKSKRYFSNLFLQYLGGGDLILNPVPTFHCACSWKVIVTSNSPLQIKHRMVCVSAVGELMPIQPFLCWVAYCVAMFVDNHSWSFVQKKGHHNFHFGDFEAWILSVWSTLLMTSTAGTSLLCFGQKWLLISKWILCIITDNSNRLFCRYWEKTLKFACFDILGKLRIPIWTCGKGWSLPSWKLSWDEKIFWPWYSQ